jgi:hypothetical protein
MRKALIPLWASTLLLSPGLARAATIHVPFDATTIQQALDDAADGDTVIVAPGEYVVDTSLDFGPKDVVLRSESGPDVTVIRLSERPLAGELGSVVVFRSGQDRSSRIEGFTITGGIGSATGVVRFGGGILCRGSSPTIASCRIIGNVAAIGGGIHCEGGAPLVQSCSIVENEARAGGGVSSSDSGLEIVDSSISNNTASRECEPGSCSGGSAGGMSISGESRVELADCRIIGNRADLSAGGLSVGPQAQVLLERSTIHLNVASLSGGGIEIHPGAGSDLRDCVVSGNRSAFGAGISGGGVLDHCTVAGNAVGGGIAGSGRISSSIVWGNGGGSFMALGGSGPEVSYSLIDAEAVWPGEGNINGDPLFCGRPPAPEVFVDAGAAPGGDGSPERPFQDLQSAVGFFVSLSADSPCLGAAMDGGDMGAGSGRCDGSPPAERRIHIAAGRYDVGSATFSGIFLVQGAGEGLTFLVGTVSGMTGRMEALTVTGGTTHGGIVVGSAEAPEIIDVTIEGNVSEEQGGGILCRRGSRPVFRRATIRGNSALGGGGVHCDDLSEPAFFECLIEDNRAYQQGGGVLCSQSGARFVGCTIRRNQLEAQNGDGGGARVIGGATVLEDCVITRNVSDRGAGVSGPARLEHCTLTGNSGREVIRGPAFLRSSIVWNNDGPPFGFGDDAPAGVAFSCVAGGVAPGEGNISEPPMFCGWGDLVEVHVDPAAESGSGTADAPLRTIGEAVETSLGLAERSPCIGAGEGGTDMGADRGTCVEAGGGLRTVHLAAGTYRAPLVWTDAGASLLGAGMDETIIHGAILGLQSGARLSDLSVTGSAGQGGVRVAAGATPVLSRIRVAGNSAVAASGLAGGITCGAGSSTLLEDCIIEGNLGMLAGGVGCESGASVALLRCMVLGNGSLHSGGGVGALDGGSILIENCVIAGNAANLFGEGHGAAISAEARSLEIRNSTIVGNAVVDRFFSWAVLGARSTTILNTIIWGNATRDALVAEPRVIEGSDIEGLPRGGGNLGLAPNFLFEGEFDFGRFREISVGARTERLPDFLVQAPDLRAARESPTVDAGIATGAPPTDIDGLERPCWAAIDIGAYEYCEVAQPIVRKLFARGDVNGDSKVQISDPIFLLGFLFSGPSSLACLDAADADDSGKLEITDAIFSLNFLFLGEVTIPEPVSCGVDPTFDEGLDCEAHACE